MARSPRSNAPSSSSVMAVDLPVPVVPMILKCLVSSAGPTSTPAKAIALPQVLKADIRFQACHPDSTRAPRLYRSMASIPSNDQIVRLLSVGRRLAVHTDAESCAIAATPQIDSRAPLLEIYNP